MLCIVFHAFLLPLETHEVKHHLYLKHVDYGYKPLGAGGQCLELICNGSTQVAGVEWVLMGVAWCVFGLTHFEQLSRAFQQDLGELEVLRQPRA